MELAPLNQENTISSLQIAEKTGKRHDNVNRDIKSMLTELGVSPLKFEGIYLDAQGKNRKCYHLDEKHANCLAMGYSAQLRMAMLELIEELRAAKPAITKIEALKLALEAEEKLVQAEKDNVILQDLLSDKDYEINQQRKGKEALQDMMDQDNSMSVKVCAGLMAKSGILAESGKLIGRNTLYTYLRSIGWVFQSETLPTQIAIDTGYTEQGDKETTRITFKGLFALCEKLSPGSKPKMKQTLIDFAQLD